MNPKDYSARARRVHKQEAFENPLIGLLKYTCKFLSAFRQRHCFETALFAFPEVFLYSITTIGFTTLPSRESWNACSISSNL